MTGGGEVGEGAGWGEGGGEGGGSGFYLMIAIWEIPGRQGGGVLEEELLGSVGSFLDEGWKEGGRGMDGWADGRGVDDNGNGNGV